jgi:PAS domain S-box-containing protein
MNQPWNSFIEQMNVVLLTLDMEGNFISLNPTAEKIFSRPAAELIGKPFTVVLDPFSHQKAAMMIARTLAEGGVAEWELDHLRGDDTPVLLGYTTTRLQDEKGHVLGLGAYGVDLSAKLDLTEKLAQTNQQLEGALIKLEKTLAELKSTQIQLVQAEKMRTLGQLVAGIAHEINNPAAFVANNLEQLQDMLPKIHHLYDAYIPLKKHANPQQLSVIQNAEKNSDLQYMWDDLRDITSESIEGMDRIRNIVLSLRTFSHIDEAGNKLADLTDGLRSTIQLIRPLCKNRIEIIENLQPLPQIYCHPGELNQVFLNLLTNAAQAIAGEGQIEISTHANPGAVEVKIRDTGCGMKPETLQRLGEPFFTTKPVGAGTGLGISIAYGILERHHAKMEFQSRPGAGTTVSVQIPAQQTPIREGT